VVNRELLRKLGELFSVVDNFDHGFRGGADRQRTDEPDGPICTVIRETAQPVRRNDRVVVTKDNNLSLGCRDAPVHPRATAALGIDLHMKHVGVMMLVHHGASPGGACGIRPIIEHKKLEVRVAGVG